MISLSHYDRGTDCCPVFLFFCHISVTLWYCCCLHIAHLKWVQCDVEEYLCISLPYNTAFRSCAARVSSKSRCVSSDWSYDINCYRHIEITVELILTLCLWFYRKSTSDNNRKTGLGHYLRKFSFNHEVYSCYVQVSAVNMYVMVWYAWTMEPARLDQLMKAHVCVH